MEFPWVRVRRTRRTRALRALTRSTRVPPEALVPVGRVPVEAAEEASAQWARQCVESGRLGLYLAPSAKRRDGEGSEAWNNDAPFVEGVRGARAVDPDLSLWAEIDLSVYLKSGRAAALVDGWIDAESARENLGKVAITLAEAGADVVSVRGVLDGAVSAVREALEEAGFDRVCVLALSADLHGPLTELRPSSAEKEADLLDPADLESILRQSDLDVSEGADFLGVQPCLFSQDILSALAEEHDLPIVARLSDQDVKAVESMARSGLGSLEVLSEAFHTALARAGARIIVTPWSFHNA